MGGHPVILVSRREHAEAILQSGLTLKTSKGVLRPALSAASSARDVSWNSEDIIFLTSKSQSTRSLLADMENAPAEIPVFCFQNGVRNEQWASGRFANVYGGLVNFSVNFIEPGAVEHTRNNILAIGRYPNGVDETAKRVGAELTASGFQVEFDGNVMASKWGKLLINLNNALYALVDTWLQKAYTEEITRHFLAETMREGLRVLRAAGIDVAMGAGEPPIEEFIEKLDRGGFAHANPSDLPPDRRTYPSTWQDVVLRRTTTEVEHFNGEIVEIGKTVGLPTPYNTALLEMMRELLRLKAMPGLFTLEEVQNAVRSQA